MKRFGFSLVLLFVGLVAQATEPTLSVTARQRYPWNGFVDVVCTVQGMGNSPLAFMAKNNTTGKYLNVKTLTLNGKAWTNGVSSVADGTYRFVWNAASDVAAGTVLKDVSFMVMNGYPRYVAIDLSGGAEAASYPVEYFDDIPDGAWSDEYKTTKLVMRLISAGTFTMGSPADELGRSTDEDQHQVTLTKPFYMGVFEVTQKQYELVMGSNPSLYKGDMRPVEFVSWNAITASDGFLARVTKKAGLNSSLPTEAQWEYACRAGTTTALNNGKNLTDRFECANVAEVGRYQYNKGDGHGGASEHAAVGSYLPNVLGLYDMHGNVFELCSDWYGALDTTETVDPTGVTSGEYRVIRGGCWNYGALYLRSAYRYAIDPSFGDQKYGFRLSCLMDESNQKSATVSLKLDLRLGMRISNGAEENIVYDPLWDGDKNSTVKVIVRGTSDAKEKTLVDGSSTDGMVQWKPSQGGLYELTHTTYQNGTAIETLTAKFEVLKNPDESYWVIDLSGGAAASSYPISFLSKVPEGGWTDEYKTTKLVMRYIPAGAFMMQGNRPVTLTQPFYMGVFEVTQKQYELVMGSNPAQYLGDMRPVERVSWDTLTASDGFLARLAEKSGLNLSLPTEAQWEYACRAGTTNSFNNGTESMEGLGRYDGNKDDGIGGYSEHTVVGSYLPNAWGLYDMHGNVWEWCLDWYESSLGTESVIDPTGASSGTTRMARGGCWNNALDRVALSFRGIAEPSKYNSVGGLRLVSKCRYVSEVAATGVDVVYDGMPHSITVNAPESVTVEYALAEDGEYSSDNPVFMDVVDATVWYRVSMVGYNAVVGSATVKIAPREISNVTIGSITDQVYTGAAITPSVTVTDGEPSIVTENDYTVSYANNINVGTATVTLTGKGNYTGTKTANFTIKEKQIVPDGDDEPGEGDLVKPDGGVSKFDVIVMYDGKGHTINTNALEAVTLSQGTPTFSYSLTKDGAWSAVAPVWTNVVATSVWYRISAPNYEDYVHEAKVTITNRPVTLTSADGSWEFDGTAHSKKEVTVGGNGFVAGDEPTYSDFTEVTNVGAEKNLFKYAFKDEVIAKNYLVTVVEGTLTVTTGTISPDAVSAEGYAGIYDGEEHSITVNVPDGATVKYSLEENGEYVSKKPTFKDVCDTTVWYRVEKTGYNTFIGSAKVTIAPREVVIEWVADEFTYNGTDQKANVTASYKDVAGNAVALKLSLDGEFKDYNESGYVFTASFAKGETNYALPSELTKVYHIKKAVVAKVDTPVVVDPVVYETKLGEILIGGWKWNNEAIVPTVVNDGYEATLKVDGVNRDYLAVEGYDDATQTITRKINVVVVEKEVVKPAADATKFVYDGSEHVYTVSESVYYTVADNTRINAGKQDVVVSLKDKANYKWSDNTKDNVKLTFVVESRDLSNVTIADIADQVYNGSEIKPTVTVTDGTPSIVTENDYTVSYSGNINAGIATVTLTGKGNYKGTKTTTFAIKKKQIVPEDGDELGGEGLVKPTGGVSKFDVTVMYDGEGHTINTNALEKFTIQGATVKFEYALAKDGAWLDVVPVWTNVVATSVWYRISAPNYADYIHEAKVTITARDIANVTIADIADQVYNGSEIEPTVTVTDIVDGNDIIKKSDYDVSYEKNVNAGTATVTLTGKGNYTGTKTATFTIKKKPLVNPFAPDGEGGAPTDEQLAAASYEGEYDGAEHGIDVEAALSDAVKNLKQTITYADKTDGDYRDENYLYSDVVTTSVWYKIVLDNFEPFVTNATVKILPKEVTIDWVEDNFVYNGSDQKASVTASYKDVNGATVSLTVTTSGEFKDYNESGYVFTASFAKGETNYKLPSEVTKVYHIKKAGSVTVTTPAAPGSVVYGTKLSEIPIASWTWVDAAEIPTVVNTGYKATLTVDDRSTDYSGVEGYDPTTHTITRTITVTVTPKPLTLKQPTKTKVYDGTALTFGVDEITADGYVDNEKLNYSNFASITKVGNCEASFDVADSDTAKQSNYDITINKGTLTVTKATIAPEGGDEPGGEGLVKPTGGVSKYDVTVMYDGEGHTVNTNALEKFTLQGATVKFSYSLNGKDEWSGVAPVFTNVCEASVWYKISAPNYEDYVHEAKVTITPRDLSNVTIAAIDEQVYSGSAITPTVTVTDIVDGNDILKASDYDVSYSDNVNAGTATVTLTGKGNYEGTTTTDFTIKKKPLVNPFAPDGEGGAPTEAQLAAVGYEGEYDGEEQGINVEVALSEAVKDRKPTITYADKKDGDYRDENYLYSDVVTTSVWYKIVLDNFEPFVTNAAVKILPKEVTIDWVEDNFVYNGKDQKASVTASYKDVNDATTPLTVTTSGEFKDYNEDGYLFTASFARGETNYKLSSEVTKVYHIKKAVVSKVDTPVVVDPVVYETKLGEILIGGWKWKDETIVPTVVNDGYEATLKVDGVNRDYLAVEGYDDAMQTITRKINVVVVEKEVVKPAADVTKFVYDGSEHVYAVAESVYYTVADNTRINAGKQDVVVSLKDKANYQWADDTTEDVKFTFVIAKADNEWTTKPSIANWTYGEAASTPVAQAKVGAWSVTYDGGTLPTMPGTYSATFTVAESENYKALSKTVSFTIHPAGIEFTASDTIVEYNGQAHGIALAVTKPANAVIKYSETGADGTWVDALAYTDVCTDKFIHFTISADGYTTVTSSKKVTITPRDIAKVTIADIANQVYTGSEIKPQVTVTDGEPSIIKASDYDVSYEKNVNAGTATVTLTGKGNYTGTKTVNFTIKKKPLVNPFAPDGEGGQPTDEQFAAVGYEGEYDGEEHSINVEAALSEAVKELKPTITYADKKDGDYRDENYLYSDVVTTSVWYKIVLDNFEPFVTNATVKILPKEVTIDWVEDNFVYNGADQKANVTASYKDVAGNVVSLNLSLEGEFKDYNESGYVFTVSFANDETNYALPSELTKVYHIKKAVVSKVDTPVVENAIVYETTLGKISIGAWKWVDEAIVPTVVNEGYLATLKVEVSNRDYSGVDGYDSATQTITRKIPVVVIEKEVAKPMADATKFVYNGTKQIYTVAENVYYRVSGNTRTDVGVQDVSVALKDNVNYKWVDGTKNDLMFVFTIEPREISNVTVADIDAQVYSGSEIMPTVTVTDIVDGANILKASDYDVSYENNINAGTATVTLTGKGNYTGMKTATFMIKPKPMVNPFDPDGGGTGGPTEAQLAAIGYEGVYDGASHGINVVAALSDEVKALGPTITYADRANGTYRAENYRYTDVVTTSVWFKITMDNYDPFVTNATVKITPRALTLASPTKTKIYDGTALTFGAADITASGYVTGEQLTYFGFASQTKEGVCKATFTVADSVTAKVSNYDITFVNGTLTVVEDETTNVPDAECPFKWEAIDAKCARILGLKNPGETMAKMVIPDRIEGLYVTEIAKGAFANTKCGVKELVLSVFCTTIGDKAFLNIPTLERITFVKTRDFNNPSLAGKLTIGRYAFSGAVSLTELELPEMVASLGDYAFLNTRKLSSVTILGKPKVGTQVFRSSGMDVGGVTVHLDPALAGDTEYMDAIKANMYNVKVITSAIVTGLKMAAVDVSEKRVKLTVSVEKAASWGEVDTSAVRVKYRSSLTESAQMLSPDSVVRNPDGSITVEVIPPEGGSGFFQTVIEK